MSDLETITGSVLLDRLTFPVWWLMCWWSKRHLDRRLGIKGPESYRRLQRRRRYRQTTRGDL